jgi:hypothetical protein
MRFLHCKNWIAFASVVLIALCCSCEKHRPGELSDESTKQTERENQTGTEPEKASPSVAPTPAEFFPESSPH